MCYAAGWEVITLQRHDQLLHYASISKICIAFFNLNCLSYKGMNKEFL